MKNKIEIIIIGLITTLISIGISVALFVAAVAVYDYHLKQELKNDYDITKPETRITNSINPIYLQEKVETDTKYAVYDITIRFRTNDTKARISYSLTSDKKIKTITDFKFDGLYNLAIIPNIEYKPVQESLYFNPDTLFVDLISNKGNVDYSWTLPVQENVKPIVIEKEVEANLGLIIGISILGITTILGIGYIIYDNVFYTENLIKDTIKKIKGKK